MLKIAAASLGDAPGSLIPALFEEAAYLLILDADTMQCLEVIPGTHLEPLDRSLYFANRIVELDCEAAICGELEAGPFAILAEENGVTRYMAAGLPAMEALERMNRNALPILTDFIGGTGCPDNDPENCEHDHHHDD